MQIMPTIINNIGDLAKILYDLRDCYETINYSLEQWKDKQKKRVNFNSQIGKKKKLEDMISEEIENAEDALDNIIFYAEDIVSLDSRVSRPSHRNAPQEGSDNHEKNFTKILDSLVFNFSEDEKEIFIKDLIDNNQEQVQDHSALRSESKASENKTRYVLYKKRGVKNILNLMECKIGFAVTVEYEDPHSDLISYEIKFKPNITIRNLLKGCQKTFTKDYDWDWDLLSNVQVKDDNKLQFIIDH